MQFACVCVGSFYESASFSAWSSSLSVLLHLLLASYRCTIFRALRARIQQIMRIARASTALFMAMQSVPTHHRWFYRWVFHLTLLYEQKETRFELNCNFSSTLTEPYLLQLQQVDKAYLSRCETAKSTNYHRFFISYFLRMRDECVLELGSLYTLSHVHKYMKSFSYQWNVQFEHSKQTTWLLEIDTITEQRAKHTNLSNSWHLRLTQTSCVPRSLWCAKESGLFLSVSPFDVNIFFCKFWNSKVIACPYKYPRTTDCKLSYYKAVRSAILHIS